MKKKMIMAIISAMVMLTACGATDSAELQAAARASQAVSGSSGGTASSAAGDSSVFAEPDAEELFTDRDMEQTPDLSEAVTLSVESGSDITIDKEGVYVLSGSAENVTVKVEAGSEDKVQLVLDGLSVSNTDQPCIYVKSADKVFITSASEDNELSVSGSFTADGDTNTDAVIFSKDDLVLNGTGSLSIVSSDNGITSKDSLKLTGGTLTVECEGSALEAHEEIAVADGSLTISRCNDGLHAEDDEDDSTGSIYIGGGSLTISAADDAIHATTLITVDDGALKLTAAEGIEATVVRINGGSVSVNASDDGINAAQKSSLCVPLFELNGGEVTIVMGAGDTDGVDSNGDIRINGGTIDISGQSAFDYDGSAEYNGGTIIENGKETNAISNQMFGGQGGGMGGRGGRNGAGEGMRMHPEQNGQTPPEWDGQTSPEWDGQTPPEWDGQTPPDRDGRTQPNQDSRTQPVE
ncbi:MAG: carbohydrate-binding domain-containing protein [Lachnospiraceae bacterium]|nr:carbohydrate-binding domain-containing protein [Lachnospiraceae bacterium]